MINLVTEEAENTNNSDLNHIAYRIVNSVHIDFYVHSEPPISSR